MGQWGLGVFENDHAADMVIELKHALEPEVNGLMASTTVDGEAIDSTVAAIVLLGVLAEHCEGSLPEPAVVRKWRDKVLSVFDATASGLWLSSESATERRKIIDSALTHVVCLAEERDEADSP